MIPEFFRSELRFGTRGLVISCLCILTSLFSLSCNQPFQPEVQYTPKLNVYSILFADAQAVYVRVMPVLDSPSGVSQPVHGASVQLFGNESGMPIRGISLADTSEVIDGDTVSFYYAPVHIVPGGNYYVSVAHDGYPPATANVTVPFGYATIPDQGTYTILRKAYNVNSEINFEVSLSGLASAAFVQMLVEYRGIDSAGDFHMGSFSVLPIDSLNPFIEVEATSLPITIDTVQYQTAFNLAELSAIHLKNYHMYVNIIVTQVDDNLYRFFITSMRTLNPLVMRTDKIIFTNIFNRAGTGIIAGASVDTTRIFLR